MTYTKLDQTDVAYLQDILIKAAATWQMQMTDPNLCEVNRDLAREKAKMADKALCIITNATEGGAK